MSTFKKTAKQVEAILLLAASYMCALYGGSRSGKTFIIIYALIVRASKTQSRHVVIRKTFNAVKRAIVFDTLPKVMNLCFPKLTYELNKTDWFITLPNGSEIWFAGLDDKKRAEKILGMEFSTIYFNEASELDYSSIQIAISRLAQKNSLTKRVWFDFNPPTKSHWSYWLFIKKLDPLENEPLEEPEMYSHLLMNPTDNMANLDENYLKILERMPKEDRDRFMKGLFAESSDGQAYYAFDREIHVADTVKTPGTMFIGMDFNVSPMTATIVQYVNNTFYFHDEFFLGEKGSSDTYKMAHALKKAGYTGCKVIPDSTGANRKTSGKSDHLILNENGFTVMPTRNPFVTDRVNNVNRILSDNRVVINPKCKKLINDLEKVSWKSGNLDQKTDTMLTHISDGMGYVLWKLDPITYSTGKRTHSERR